MAKEKNKTEKSKVEEIVDEKIEETIEEVEETVEEITEEVARPVLHDNLSGFRRKRIIANWEKDNGCKF